MITKDLDMNLFKDFEPVSHQEWLNKITQDLKGKNFEETLVWKTDEGINVQPVYNAESLANNISQNIDINNTDDWEIREQINISSIKGANQKALNALKGGANSIQFNGEIANQEEMNQLLDGIQLDIIHIHFYTSTPTQTLTFLKDKLKADNINEAQLNGSISFDFLGEVLINGNWNTSEDKAFATLLELEHSTNSLKTTVVKGINYTNAGATAVQEIAYTLSQAVEYIHQLTEQGVSAEKAINSIEFHLGVNSNYFFEIAKIRAFKILWQMIAASYGVENHTAMIHSQTTTYNIAAQDAQTNILRTTTEGMSAVLGGCNSLSITPFKHAYEEASDFSLRVARNIQIILKEEAYLNKVKDIAKGAYYIETLTDELINKSLALFKETEQAGGFLASIKSGQLQKNIHQVNANKEEIYASGDRSLLGVNIHINKMEDAPTSTINLNTTNTGEIAILKQVNIPQELAQKESTHA